MVAACAAVVLIEIAAVTGVFAWVQHPFGTPGPSVPDLNPDGQTILAIPSNITYFGGPTGYFPALNGTDLCGGRCPELPHLWISDRPSLPSEIGVFFYYNVTNVGTTDVNLSPPVLATSGPIPTLFFLQTYCCWSGTHQSYWEMISSPVQLTPGTIVGLEGYAFTTVALPKVPAGGYTLFVNFTSD